MNHRIGKCVSKHYSVTGDYTQPSSSSTSKMKRIKLFVFTAGFLIAVLILILKSESHNIVLLNLIHTGQSSTEERALHYKECVERRTCIHANLQQSTGRFNVTIARLYDKWSSRQSAANARNSALQTYLNTTGRCSVTHTIFGGRLGNFLFMIASLFGIARHNNCTPYLQRDYDPESHFHNLGIVKKNLNQMQKEGAVVWSGRLENEDEFAIFMPWLTSLNMTNQQVFLLRGYLQSWKYFHDYCDDIRALFLFKAAVYHNALSSISAALEKSAFELKDPSQSPLLIGIHLRRGDMLKAENANFGHTAAPDGYFLNVTAELQKEFPGAIFVVASEELSYSKNLFKGNSFVFLEGNNEAEDMAALSLMDVLVLSVGTYGWWSAYLGDAQRVYYYNGWPRTGSAMEKFIHKEDFFLPEWIPRQ